MKNPFELGYPAADDLLLVPAKGILRSRGDAVLKPFLYSAPMDRVTGYWLTKKMLELGEIPVISRFLGAEERQRCLTEFHSTEAFFAIGGTAEHLQVFLDEIKELLPTLENETTFYINVAVDIAHGYSVGGIEAVRFLRDDLKFVNYIMSGSVATGQGAIELVKAGASHIRVGIGGGSACTTRINTAVGVPTITSVYDVARALKTIKSKAIVIADGGIKTPGCAVKNLAAGATGIMMGHEFAKCFESPGWDIQMPDYSNQMLVCGPAADRMPKAYVKTYRGQASAEFQVDRHGEASWCPEGASAAPMNWEGDTVESTIMKYRGGLSSAISYLGLTSIDELIPEKVEFIQITNAGRIESLDHANLK